MKMRAPTCDQGENAERHHQHGDHQVGDGQRHEEVVGHVLQSTLPADGQADEDVAGRRRRHQGQRQQRPVVVVMTADAHRLRRA